MNKIVMCAVIFLFLFPTACKKGGGDGDSGSSPRDNYTGTWTLHKTTCDGETLSTSGLEERFDLNQEERRGRNTVSTDDCMATTNLSIERTGSTLSFENGTYSCSPESCSMRYTVTVGKKDIKYNNPCPRDFPSNEKMRARLSASGNSFTMKLISLNNQSCQNTYVRK